MPQPKEVEAYACHHIYPVLEKFGATVVETHFDAQPSPRSVILVIEYKDQKIDVHSSTLHLGPIRFLLEHWDDVEAVIQNLMKVNAPFESDIYVRSSHDGRRIRNVETTPWPTPMCVID